MPTSGETNVEHDYKVDEQRYSDACDLEGVSADGIALQGKEPDDGEE